MNNPNLTYSIHVAEVIGKTGVVYTWRRLHDSRVYATLDEAWSRVQFLEDRNPGARYSVVIQRVH